MLCDVMQLTFMFCTLRRSHSLNESKKQNYELLERLQSLQHEISDNEVRRAELEGQVKQANAVSNLLLCDRWLVLLKF